jgi:Family of unknown function (DUF6498)
VTLSDGLLLGLGNVVPLIGAIFFGWDLPQILLMYWLESGVVGVIGGLKIRAAMDRGGAQMDGARSVLSGRVSGGTLVAALWLTAYLGFWAILGIFIVQIVNGGFYEGASTTGFHGVPADIVVGGTISLLIGHLWAFYRDYVRGRRYITDSLLDLQRTPFARPLVLIGAIAVGGVGTAIAGASVGFLGAMVVAKTAIEIWWARSAPPADRSATADATRSDHATASSVVDTPAGERPR